MGKKLSPKQLSLIVAILILLTGVLGYRYFTAPIRSQNEHPEDRALHGITIVSVDLALKEHRPPPTINVATDVFPDAPMGVGSSTSMGAGGGAAEPYATFEANRSGLVAKAFAYLKQSGIPIEENKPLGGYGASVIPVSVKISFESFGNILSYAVVLERPVFVSQQATEPIRVQLLDDYPVTKRLTASIGPTTPSTLSTKQEEAMGKALEAVVERWRYDNPAPTETR